MEQIDLKQFEKSVYSQNGEDGVIERIFNQFGIIRGTFLDIGAGDGRHLSNTRYLKDKGWDGPAVECDYEKWLKLQEDRGFYAVCAKITCEPGKTAYDVLDVFGVKPDFISIDTDGNDYWILENIMKANIRPYVVCVEYNPKWDESVSIPYDKDISWKGTSYYGASGAAYCNLMMEYGYRMVSCLGAMNLIFTIGEEFKFADIDSCDPFVADERESNLVWV